LDSDATLTLHQYSILRKLLNEIQTRSLTA